MTAVVTKTLLLGEAVGNSTAFKNGDLIVALLLLVLGIALGIGVTCLVMVVHFLRKGRLINRPIARRINLLTRERRSNPPIFNLPTRWMAVRRDIRPASDVLSIGSESALMTMGDSVAVVPRCQSAVTPRRV